jgi:CheY-like chemotaxis protein
LAPHTLPEFESQLQDTLNHLYNPLFHPNEQVVEVLGMKPPQSMDAVRQALKVLIEGLKPDAETPSGAYTRRFYEILNYRYLASLSQEETSVQLGMTSRNLRRYQQQAVHALAQKTWEAHLALIPSGGMQSESSPAASSGRLPVLQELEVLQQNSPGAVSEIGESFERVKSIARALVQPLQITLEFASVTSPMTASVHPSLLNQILLAVLEELARYIQAGSIRFSSSQHSDQVAITAAALQPAEEIPFVLPRAVREVLDLIGGEQEVYLEGSKLQVCLRFPAAAHVPVLLVDDNPDFFYLFQRYAQRTRYVIHNIREGARLTQALVEFNPQIIVLDVLLPDVDGWKLLVDLQNPAANASIPVIVCSAMGQKELAYSLGARAYLPKPVSRELFLQTLDALSA